MITVVTLNPCVDKTVVLEQFKYGETNRVLNSRTDIGGKGINVSLVLKELKTCSTNLLIDYTVGN
ncbi:MAG: hypothetical protein IJ261_03205, partial [Clostridia bacterium]|nr:hypothetical protein [Clostridia bacterium]